MPAHICDVEQVFFTEPRPWPQLLFKALYLRAVYLFVAAAVAVGGVFGAQYGAISLVVRIPHLMVFPGLFGFSLFAAFMVFVFTRHNWKYRVTPCSTDDLPDDPLPQENSRACCARCRRNPK
eukprot:GHVT01074045.1.p2 GENE.GHVT01074045.1~~GHVT01074045.1.p2  ORF type:complete len:122 (+),score=2.85 GHVT01074045.1:2817-3182(+)